MMYTKEEKEKIYENLDKIKAYLEALQPKIRNRIEIDFGPMKTYANWDREKAYHLYISNENISGRSGGLGLDYEREYVGSSTRATVYDQLDYATTLISDWSDIKRQINAELINQQRTINAINNFEI